MTYREKFPQLYRELDSIRDAPKPVFLIPDDILTLKLLRDEFNSTRFTNQKDPRRALDHIEVRRPTLETLERILKQIQ